MFEEEEEKEKRSEEFRKFLELRSRRRKVKEVLPTKLVTKSRLERYSSQVSLNRGDSPVEVIEWEENHQLPFNLVQSVSEYAKYLSKS